MTNNFVIYALCILADLAEFVGAHGLMRRLDRAINSYHHTGN